MDGVYILDCILESLGFFSMDLLLIIVDLDECLELLFLELLFFYLQKDYVLTNKDF